MDNILSGRTYEEVVAAFRWDLPARYNLGLDVCERWAAREPDRIALIDAGADRRTTTMSYGTLAQRSNRLANALAAAGIARGDRVAVLMPQMPDTAVAHVAIYKLGAIAVPLANVFGVDAIEYRIDDAGVRALITTVAGAEKVAPVAGKLDLIVTADGAGPGAQAMEEMIAAAADGFAPADTGPDDPVMIIYTSGTTGKPKGALHGQRVVIGHLPCVQMHHDLLPRPGDLLWTPADWAWAGGLLDVLLPGLRLGVPVLSHRIEKFDPERAWALMAAHKVRNVFLPPTALRLLKTAPPPQGLALRTIGSGGESLGSETYEWARASLGVSINEFYGQTECNLVLSSCAALGVGRPGAIGKAVPGHTVAVVGADGTPLPPGEAGTIAVRRPDPVMFLEYWGRPEATREKFVGDWLLTGDQGTMDAEGYFTFVGRDDDIITSSGYRIGPGEIEDCLASHPAVAVAAVVGKPDPVRTEIVKAYVLPARGIVPDDALAEQIRRHVRERLSAHEYPREIEFVEDMPLTTTGKVIRRVFRDRARAEAEAEAHRH